MQNVWFSLHLIWISTNRNVDRCLDKRTKKSRTYRMVQASEHWRALPETKFQERRSFCFRCCGGLQPNRGPVSGLRSFIVGRYHAIVRWLVLKLSSVGCLTETWDRAKNILFLLRHDSGNRTFRSEQGNKRMHGCQTTTTAKIAYRYRF